MILKINQLKSKFLAKYNFYIFLFLVILLFVVLRVVNLGILPVFADEAIYIRWSQIIANDPAHRFIPLSDGKQPLFMWLAALIMKLNILDPLIGGRLVSVIAGLLGLSGVGSIAWLFTKNKRIMLFSMFLYAITPFLVFYDRLAVVDGLLTALGIWIFYLSVLLVNSLRLDIALILGSFLGAALLTKSTALFFIMLLPSLFLLFDFKSGRIYQRTIKTCLFFGLSLFISFIIYNVLRLSPLFYIINLRRSDFIFNLSEVLETPYTPFLPRMFLEIPLWLGQYLTWPLFVIGLIFGIYFVFKKEMKILVLLIWFLVPLIVESFIAKGFTPRYFVFTVPFFLLILSFGLEIIFLKFKQHKLLFYAIFLVLAMPAFLFDFWLLFNPQKADVPQKERSGYLEEWSSGYGIREVASFIKERAKHSKVVVGTEGYFGTLPNGLEMYLASVANVTVIGIGLPVTGPPDQLINSLADAEVYLVANSSRITFENHSQLELVQSFPKAVKADNTRENLLLFKVKIRSLIDFKFLSCLV